MANWLYCLLLTISIKAFSSPEVVRVHPAECFESLSMAKPNGNDSTIVFEITAEAHGFMCPFLTPMYIDRLKAEGAIEVSKSPELTITAVYPSGSTVNEESLRKWAAMVGYEKDKIHARKK